MDRKITLLASMAMLGSKAVASIRYDTTTNAFPKYETTNGSYTAQTSAFGENAYLCVRRGNWYFFPQTSSLNFPSADTVNSVTHRTWTFYGWDNDFLTQTDPNQGAADAAKKNSAHDGTQGQNTVASTQDMTARCCETYTNADTANCKEVADRGVANAAGNAVAFQIPVGRVYYKGPTTAVSGYVFTASAVDYTGTTEGTASVAGQNAGANYTNADSANFFSGTATQVIFTWNNDFLLAGLWQKHKKGTTTDGTGICSDHDTATPSWLTIDSSYDNANSDATKRTFVAKAINGKNKCTWFIKVNSDASTGSAGAAFLLQAAANTQFNLHWAEWSAGTLSATNQLLPNTSATPLFLGTYPSTYEWPNPMMSGMKKLTATEKGASIAFPNYDKDMYPSMGLTRGNISWLSKTDGPWEYDTTNGLNTLDFNYYNSLLSEYNSAVAAYNTAAVTYSDLAKKYNDDVTARKAQIADPSSSSFQTQIAIPPVPCLAFDAPSGWPGYKFAGSGDTTLATVSAVSTSASAKDNTMFHSIKAADGTMTHFTQVTNAKNDMRAGWMQVTKNAVDASAAYSDYAGTLHVQGHFGQEIIGTDLATSQTALKTMKGWRYYKEASGSEVVHYMMVGVYPYDEGDTTTWDITLDVYKVEWSSDAIDTFTATAAVAPVNTVTDAQQFGGAKALVATATAFAAVAMTLQ